MKKDKTAGVAGAQTVDRACELLQQVALAGFGGARMLDLCENTGLSRPTVHRIVRSLAAAGMLHQRSDSRRYHLGPMLYELGLSAPSPVQAFPEVREAVQRLADKTEDTASLMLRAHDDAVCAWHAEGSYPIKANVMAIGSRRPLAAGVAGLSILAALPEAEAKEILAANASQLPRFCQGEPATVTQLVTEGRKVGYVAAADLVMEGVTAIGMAVPARFGRSFLAVSVSAVSSRFSASRMPAILELLRECTRTIAQLQGT